MQMHTLPQASWALTFRSELVKVGLPKEVLLHTRAAAYFLKPNPRALKGTGGLGGSLRPGVPTAHQRAPQGHGEWGWGRTCGLVFLIQRPHQATNFGLLGPSRPHHFCPIQLPSSRRKYFQCVSQG